MLLKSHRVEFISIQNEISYADIAISDLTQLDAFLEEVGIADEIIISKKPMHILGQYYYGLGHQLLLLVQLRAVINTNVNVGDIMVNWFKKDKQRLPILVFLRHNKVGLPLYLETIGFTPIVKEIINASKNDQLDNALDRAIVVLKSEIKLNQETGGVLSKNIPKVAFAIVTLLFTPSLIKFLSGDKNNQKDKQDNVVIDTMLWLDSHALELLLVFSFVALFVFLYKTKVRQVINNVYPFNLFFKIVDTKVGLLFINILLASNCSGIKNTSAINQFGKINRTCNKQANILLEEIKLNQFGLSEALLCESLQFTPSLVLGMSVFDKTATDTEKNQTLELLIDVLTQEMQAANTELSRFANVFSTVILISLVFIIFYAVMLPRFAAIQL